MLDASASPAVREPTPAEALDDCSQAVYRVVYYYNLFDYPVRSEELARLTGFQPPAVTNALRTLATLSLIERHQDYVFVAGRGWIIGPREDGEACFLAHYQRIQRAAWWLSHVPFVRGLLLTGRLSKGLLSEYDDFDFLVVAAKNRARLVWMLIFLLRRLISLNYRNGNFKYFCCNYVLGEDVLAIQDRDVFIAMEAVCAHPIFNRPLFERFRTANAWRLQYFQERGKALPPDLMVTRRWGWIQRLLEIPLNLLWNTGLRRFSEDYYRRRWLQLGIVKDEADYRQKASEGYVKPDTGARRKFIVDHVARLDPTEHHSFLRTKINLHRGLMKHERSDILLTHACLFQPIRGKNVSQPAAASLGITTLAGELRQRGYRVECYDPSWDKNLVEIFRLVKARLIPLVGIAVSETTRQNASQMIKLFHDIGARTVICGPDAVNHASWYLEHDADVVIAGEGAQPLLELLDHVYTGSVALEAITGIVYAGKEKSAIRIPRADCKTQAV